MKAKELIKLLENYPDHDVVIWNKEDDVHGVEAVEVGPTNYEYSDVHVGEIIIY